MKTLIEIIETCKSGEAATVDEMRMAICAMDGLSTMDRMELTRMADKEPVAMILFEKKFYRWKAALNKTPVDYLGLSGNPDDPANQKRRIISKKVFDKFLKAAQPTTTTADLRK